MFWSLILKGLCLYLYVGGEGRVRQCSLLQNGDSCDVVPGIGEINDILYVASVMQGFSDKRYILFHPRGNTAFLMCPAMLSSGCSKHNCTQLPFSSSQNLLKHLCE